MSWINDVTDLTLDTLHQYRPKIEIYGGVAMIVGSVTSFIQLININPP